VFFGHYWLPPDHPRAPLAPNLACLDFSAARGDHPLVAYRWEGESILNPAHFLAPGLTDPPEPKSINDSNKSAHNPAREAS
jgi:hypothetical protein